MTGGAAAGHDGVVATLLETVASYLRDQRWPFEQAPGRPLFRIPFAQGEQEWMCFAEVREDQARFIFYSVAPTPIPEGDRPAVAEFLTRANYGLPLGNFELDLDDGEVRCKTSIDVTGDRLTYALVKQVVLNNLRAMHKYLPGLAEIVGGAAPKAVIARLDA